MADGQNKIIQLEDGWNTEIKAKALDPLEASNRMKNAASNILMFVVQVMLDDGFQGKTKLFSNSEYVNVYT